MIEKVRKKERKKDRKKNKGLAIVIISTWRKYQRRFTICIPEASLFGFSCGKKTVKCTQKLNDV